MKLNLDSVLNEKDAWAAAGVALPKFDVAAMREAFFKRKMVGLHREIGAARMHELGFGTRGQFASAQAKLVYGSLPEPATPGGATPCKAFSLSPLTQYILVPKILMSSAKRLSCGSCGTA